MKSRAKMINTAFALKYATPCKLVNWYVNVINWYVNVIFTLVFDFLLFCTFLNHIFPEQICVNLILRDKYYIARQKRIKDLTQIKHRL